MKRTDFRAWLVAPLALCAAAQWAEAAMPGMPAQIKVTKTVTAYYERTDYYDWSISKSASPTAIELGIGESANVDYWLDITRTMTGQHDRYGVRGEICVTNTGWGATEGLAVTDVIQTKVGYSGTSQNYIVTPIDISAKPSIGPMETYCYPYDIPFAPVPDVYYRNQAQASVTNQVYNYGSVYTVKTNVSFTLPTSPSVASVDASASISDLLACPSGFTCTASDSGPWALNDSGSVHYTLTVNNDSAECGSTYSLTNNATLTESNSGESRSSQAQVAISTKACVPDIVGCTYTQGYWKTHEDVWPVANLSLGSTNYDQTQLLSIFGEPVGGNGLINLAHQLIAAKLNAATGATVPASVANGISDADMIIGGLVVPPVGSDSLPTSDTDALVTILDNYNNGVAQDGPPHCD